MHNNELTLPLPDEIGDMTVVQVWRSPASPPSPASPASPPSPPLPTPPAAARQDLRLNDNKITGPIPDTIGKLTRMKYLDLYNNKMCCDVPPGIQWLQNLETLYLQNEHLTPVRQYYCRRRIPNVGKYNWYVIRQEYRHMTSVVCDDMHDVDFTFNSLQHSRGVTS